MRPRKARLFVETLEPRTTPATGPWVNESFDTTAIGSVPIHWESWGSTGSSGFRVAVGRTESGRSLASVGGSAFSGRTWSATNYPRDVSLKASIFADTLVPAQLFARGAALDGTKPSYYAMSVARGLDIKLLRMQDGTATELATLRSNTYASGIWLDVTLITQRNTIQGRIQRRDTGQWLNAFGDWQSAPAAALTATDNHLKSPGLVGFARSPAYAGTVYFDDLQIAPGTGDVTAPRTSSAVQPVSRVIKRGSVSGEIRLISRVGSGGPATRIDYLIDGELIVSRRERIFAVDFDSRNLTNGEHTLSVRAWDAAGNVDVSTRSFKVYNPPPSSPLSIPRHYDHIRYAALAYSGLQLGSFERALLANSVDVVVPNVRFLEQMENIASGTPKLIYSNVSNLYLEGLTDWLNYADRNRIPRESAFYHVAAATAFLGDSPSSMPVNWFWNVQRGPLAGDSGFVKLTSQAQSSQTGDVPIPGAGNALYVGYPDRFRELNFTLSLPAGAGWRGTIEYPTRVDAAGRPIEWNTLQVIADSTNGFRRSGAITFDPPIDWKPSVIAGSTDGLYYVRIRSTSGGTALPPLATRILGRDYVNAKGGQRGVIPAFDFSADRDDDGYLRDAEYAQRKPGFDARFAYESRLFYPSYGQMRFAVNPGGRGVGAWAIDFERKLLAANPRADGIFMDNSSGRLTARGPLVESTDSYTSEMSALLGAINRGIAPKWVLANTTNGGAEGERIARQVPATIEEFSLRPMSNSWGQFRDLADKVDRRLATSGTLILDSLSTGGSPTDPRTRLAALAEYYLLADAERTVFMSWGGEEPASAWDRHWFDAIAFNVGRPKQSWSLFASGSDPANPSLIYQVLRRAYDNALVLYKPLSYTPGKGIGGTSSASATTHQLGGTYRPLNADGTLGQATTSVTLRNGEGVILVRV